MFKLEPPVEFQSLVGIKLAKCQITWTENRKTQVYTVKETVPSHADKGKVLAC